MLISLILLVVFPAISGSFEFRGYRTTKEPPGLRDFELNLLRLIEKITNGTKVQLNRTGTRIKFEPGQLIGGSLLGISHACPPSRSVGYCLEILLMLAPLAKRPIELTLTGVTNDNLDLSVDTVRSVSLPLLERFGVEEKATLKVKKRGAPPLGGGEIFFSCPIVKGLKAAHLLDEGLIKRVRGLCYTSKCNPALGSRVIDSARGILNQLIPDVFIYSDHFKGADSGLSPGYAVCLVAESTTGALVSSELSSQPGVEPEALGQACAEALLKQVEAGGFVDDFHQIFVLTMMACASEDVSKARLGPLTPGAVQALRDIKAFLGVQFKFKTESKSGTVICSCVGAGVSNINRKAA